MYEAGKIKNIGISNVNKQESELAVNILGNKLVTVQNCYIYFIMMELE